ncbi:MAG: hypothetical protein ACOZE7_20960 [Pseudomonadota bacterium]|jgi:hypothetical protein|uniref:hypothetical protein n=1 Tax=Aquabacterium commune TaxID=70586 RepID=UPI003BB15628
MSANDSTRPHPVKQTGVIADPSKEVCKAKELSELTERFDQRLASLNAPQAHRALNAFMDEPVVLDGQLRAGADYSVARPDGNELSAPYLPVV